MANGPLAWDGPIALGTNGGMAPGVAASIGTTPTTIYDARASVLGALIWVFGYSNADSTIVFSDLVAFSPGTFATAQSQVNHGATAARTYSASGTQLKVAMASGAWLVRGAVAIEAR